MIPKQDDLSSERLAALVQAKISASRFTATVEVAKYSPRIWGVKISTVRLRRKKDYCGAHPGPCLALVPRKHMKARFLEGLDWVGFNAMLNDLCDAHAFDCDVFSYNREASCNGRYFIRRGTRRRVKYPFGETTRFGFRGVVLWEQGEDDCFEDHVGKPHPKVRWQDDAAGTPGFACYTLEDETRLAAELAELES